MADYIYLLEHRLSIAQQQALRAIRDLARNKSLTVFLVGGAVRDLTSGSPVRDLDIVVQGNALKLKKDVEQIAILVGESVVGQALFARFAGGVRMEIGSTLSISYPKPGKAVAVAANILDDLRRRDFTANAMALSLNDGSYGLLMDPLNGVADIENRELRLVSNYGFIEDPIRMIRAIRLGARLGWQMDEKTQARYETGKDEGYISAASAFQRGYEAEEIVHEEDPLRVLRRLESEGWMKFLAPSWTTSKVNVAELEKMRATQTQLQLQGIHPDPSSGNFPLLTAKMSAKEVAELKASFPRQGFVSQIETLDREAKEFAAAIAAKTAATPSQAWKLIHAAQPEAVLAVAYTTKSAPILARLNSFYNEWPQARQKIPYVQMQEMRIIPELPGYAELVEALFFEMMDAKLTTPEEIKAYLEPFSPPAPPPPVHLRRPRAVKKEAKPAKSRSKKSLDVSLTGDLPETIAASAAEVTQPTVAPVATAKKASATSKPAATKLATATKASSSPADAPSAAKLPAAIAATKAQTAKPASSTGNKAAPKSAEIAAVAKLAPTKPAIKAQSAIAPKTVAKTVAKTSAKTVVKTAAKTASKPAIKVVAKSSTKSAAKSVTKSAAAKPSAKPVTKVASQTKAPARPAAKPSSKATPKPQLKPVSKAKAVKAAPPKQKQPTKSVAPAKGQGSGSSKVASKPPSRKPIPGKTSATSKPSAKPIKSSVTKPGSRISAPLQSKRPLASKSSVKAAPTKQQKSAVKPAAKASPKPASKAVTRPAAKAVAKPAAKGAAAKPSSIKRR